MNADEADSNSREIRGAVGRTEEREISAALSKRWRQKLGYCSIFAAFPALLIGRAPEVRSGAATRTEPSVAGQGARFPGRLNVGRGHPASLKRQSEFLLPHQQSGFDMPATFAGNDDCPGKAIPGGSYTAAAPYSDSGDTTGANNTVTRARDFDYCYYFTDVPGPDHVYTFTLTGRGANPRIQVSRTSGTYEPSVYILDSRMGGFALGCPAGTGIDTCGTLVSSGLDLGGTATIVSQQMNSLPLNVPLHLFVDSERTDARGSGPYAIRMQDVTIAPTAPNPPPPCPDQIDCTEFFVAQQYRDFLNREPDAAGLGFWAREITSCGAEAQCAEAKRVNVSAAFFLSIEFQETGFLAYRAYAAAFGPTRVGGAVPLTLQEFLPDVQRLGRGVVVGQGDWRALLEANKSAYFDEFVTRPAFLADYPASLDNTQFVNRLGDRSGALSPEERASLINELDNKRTTRAAVLRRVAEDTDLVASQLNRAFVLMQYFGYLRRNPNDAPDADFAGYNFWLAKLDQFNGDFVQAEMVRAFISSIEYRQRFGQ